MPSSLLLLRSPSPPTAAVPVASQIPKKRGPYFGYCPHTVTVYNRATTKVLIYLYYEDYPTLTEWGAVPNPYFYQYYFGWSHNMLVVMVQKHSKQPILLSKAPTLVISHQLI